MWVRGEKNLLIYLYAKKRGGGDLLHTYSASLRLRFVSAGKEDGFVTLAFKEERKEEGVSKFAISLWEPLCSRGKGESCGRSQQKKKREGGNPCL